MIVSIVVTYDSTEFLEKAIQGLAHQTVTVDKIIIVDNDSQKIYKNKIAEIAEQNCFVEVITLNENTGGAGGFEAGMKYARDRYDPDWYWIMDDDAFPGEECLEKLLAQADQLQDVGFLAPLIYGIQRKEYQLYHHKRMKKLLIDEESVRLDEVKKSIVLPIDADAFVGPLISKKAVDLVGIVDGRLFIYGDDTEYTYRVTRKLRGYLVTNAIIDHRDVCIANNESANWWWKEYYMYRNRFLFLKKYQSMNLYAVSIFLLSMRIIKKMIAACLKPQYKGLRIFRIKLLMKCLSDGLHDRSGALLKPDDYFEALKSLNS